MSLLVLAIFLSAAVSCVQGIGMMLGWAAHCCRALRATSDGRHARPRATRSRHGRLTARTGNELVAPSSGVG